MCAFYTVRGSGGVGGRGGPDPMGWAVRDVVAPSGFQTVGAHFVLWLLWRGEASIFYFAIVVSYKHMIGFGERPRREYWGVCDPECGLLLVCP